MQPKKKKLVASARKVTFELRSLIASINGKFGEGTILLGSEAKNLGITFCSSGCYAVDYVTGGGFPENRITQLIGGFSAGKTTLLTQSMVQFQRKYEDGYCFCIDTEFAYDLKYGKALGLDLSRFLLIRPDSGEQAVDVLLDMLKQDIHIYGAVDSIPGVIPLAEIEMTVEQNFMGKHPQLINRMVKLANNRLKRSMTDEDAPITILCFLNQIREKVGLVFGNPETTPGGRGKDFFSSLILQLRGGDKLAEDIEQNGIKRKVQVGREHTVVVQKNKCGGKPFEEAKFVYYTRNIGDHVFGTYNNAETAFEYGVFHGVIKHANGKFTFMHKGSEVAYGKESSFIKFLAQTPLVLRNLHRQVLKKLQEENLPSEEEQEATPV